MGVERFRSNDEVVGDARWQTVPQSRFKEPDVLIVGNSNVRGLDSRFLKPLFATKHVLGDKTLRGAAEFLRSTEISPRQSLIIQAIDNDIGEVSNGEIIQKIEEIVHICHSRFPGVTVNIVEPLGRCYVNGPQVYWKNAVRLCDMLSSVTGVQVVAIPDNLRRADATLFVRERGGFIHLNSDGVGALSRIYKDYFLGVGKHGGGRDGEARGKKLHVAGGIDVDVGRGRDRCAADRDAGVDHGRVRRVANSGSGVGRGGDKCVADKDVGSRFGLLVHTLIEGLSKFT